MGEQRVIPVTTKKQTQSFLNHLLKDIEALERMLDDELFETDTIRIGAEQELCLVDSQCKPAPKNLAILESAKDERFVTELAKFNAEINLKPLVFEKDCLSRLEGNLRKALEKLQEHALQHGADIVLTGILPTIRKYDMEMSNITPIERYHALMDALIKMRGQAMELRLRGIDELIIKHDSPMLEACNTSFQVHLQVKPDEFAKMYNIAQAIAGPILAVAVNSPMLFGKRLWNETRIALFQQSIDTRHSSEHLRERSPRVTFGNRWLRKSILDIYQEDIARFRVLLGISEYEDSHAVLDAGKIPKLRALQVHNSTVYRWNRACYGIGNGMPHLRIENRILPSGPTVLDEVSNTAFWLGLMIGMAQEHADVTTEMEFDHAASNFTAAARLGLDTSFRWLNGSKHTAQELVLKELLPLARQGLKHMKVDKEDVDRYLSIVEARTDSGNTGSHWIIDSYAKLLKEGGSREETINTIASVMIANQKTTEPVHTWPLASFDTAEGWKPSSLLVEEFMTRDLYTVHKDDILQLAVDMLDWRKIRYMPVEDGDGHLVGLLTMRLLMRYYAKHRQTERAKTETVGSIMIKEPITISPDASVSDAMILMEQHRIGCLPVVKEQHLVGIVTEVDFLKITARMLREYNPE